MLIRPILIVILFSVFVYFSIPIYANDSTFQNEQFAIHPRFGLIYNIYSADFSSFQGAVDCGQFTDGGGLAYSIMPGIEVPINNKMHIGLSLGYIDRSGELTASSGFKSLDTTTNEVVDVITVNTIIANIGFFEFQPEVRYILTPNLINGPLRAVGGLRIAFPVKNSFEQEERIVSPENAVFNINGSSVKTRNIAVGSIETINSPAFGLTFGIENMLRIGKSNFFTQQLLFDYNFNDLTSDADWKLMAVRFEIGFRLSNLKQRTPEPKPEPVEEVIIPKDTVAVAQMDNIIPIEPALNLRYKDQELELLMGSELLASPPIVSAVFFERNSSAITNYYELNKGLESYLRQHPVSVQIYLIPRIAEIIKSNPGSTITLEGCNSGPSYEPEGDALSMRRAQAVRKAFVDYGLPENIISIKTRALPRYPSNQDYQDGVVENQRVDIIVKNAPLQEYVDLRSYYEVVGKVRHDVDFMNVPSDDSVLFITSFSQGTIRLESPGTYTTQVTERVNTDSEIIGFSAEAYIDDIRSRANAKIDVSTLPRRLVDLNLDNFEAILTYDYDQCFLSEDNKGLLRQLCEFLPAGCTIILFGSADAMGMESRNIQLEKERAEVVESFIKNISGDKFRIERDRSRFAKFDESTSQGRFLNRCFRIKLRK